MLKLNHISVCYGKHSVLEDVHLHFSHGKVYTIVGKNGSGKSTLLKACANMLPLSEGSILLEDANLVSYPPKERARRIAYLSQHRNTTSSTVERLIMHGRHPHLSNTKQMRQADWNAIEQAMGVMDVLHLRHRSMMSLSGGEQQRVYLAMLLAQDTDILLLDEPTTYMDISYQLRLLTFLQEHKKDRMVIMVLHDITQALRYSDQLILMDQGKVVQTGSVNKVIQSGRLEDVLRISITSIETKCHPFYDLELPAE